MSLEPGELPYPVRQYLEAAFGAPLALERLGGMSGGRVVLARYAGGSAVVKACATRRELRFYQRLAPVLGTLGVVTPRMLWSAYLDDTCWLVLEHIPHPLPRERWGADRELLEVLYRLHRATRGAAYRLPDMFVPAWTEQMSRQMLACFAPAVAARLRPRLEQLRPLSSGLFRPCCNISGDPNPANWGLRDDGSLVLFDWERVCCAVPALDLAITVPGLGDRAAFEQVATVYCGLLVVDGETLPSVEQLSRDLWLAKLWTVVELMSAHRARQTVATQPVVEYLIEHAPAWIERMP